MNKFCFQSNTIVDKLLKFKNKINKEKNRHLKKNITP